MWLADRFRGFASGYRKTARLTVFLIVLASLVVPAFAAPATLNITPQIAINADDPFGCGLPLAPPTGSYQASGGVLMSGSYSGPVFFNGSATIEGHDKSSNVPEVQHLAFVKGDFQAVNYPSQTDAPLQGTPSVNSDTCNPVVDGYTYWVAAYSQLPCHSSSCILANETVTATVTGGNDQMFQLIMELPMFNETTFGATVNCAPTTAPCGLPLQGFYDMIFIIAMVLSGVGALIALASKELKGEQKQNIILELVLADLFIILFPLIYDNVALLTNYLDMTIISGPGRPFTDYDANIHLVWQTLMALTSGGGLWGALVSPITTLASYIIALVVYMMTLFLGVIRIWLVTVMVIAFPISLALKLIPFTRKLSSMVEDTLYGLILASLMSSVAIGVAAYILADAPNGPIWSQTIFYATGINGISNWVAAAALFTAVLLPTVFAPLTGVIFQTASQAAMVGVGVGTSMVGGAVAPMAGVVGVGGGALGGAMGGARAGAVPLSIGQSGAATLQSIGLGSRLAVAIPHSIKNVAVAGTAGMMKAVGIPTEAIARVAPMSSAHDVSKGILEKHAARLASAPAPPPAPRKWDDHAYT